jgi:hypothetical protein
MPSFGLGFSAPRDTLGNTVAHWKATRVKRMWLPHINTMKTLICFLAGLSLVWVACGKKVEPGKPAATNTPAAGSNPLNAPADYLGAMSQAQKLAVKTVDLNAINQAVQMFYAEEDRFPRDLDELVSRRYLPRLPQPPTGMRFVYNPQTGQVGLARTPPAAPPPASKTR